MDKKALVYKSNSLIEGRYKLSANAQKIVASLISRVNPHKSDEPLPTFCLSLPELAELCAINEKKLYATISSYTKELKSLVIELRKEGSDSYRQLGLFREFEFDSDDRVLKAQFEERLDAHIRDFSGNFTRYQLIQLQDLKSRYATRLYEILRKARNMDSPKVGVVFYTVDLAELQMMLGALCKSYTKRYDRFRQRVLEVAQAELEEKTDLKFSFEPLRSGRKIAKIRFAITYNNHVKPQEGEVLKHDIPELNPTLKALILQVIPDMPETMMQALSCYQESQIKESIIDFMCARTTVDIKKPIEFFVGIVKKKSQLSNDRVARSIEDELNDIGWADDSV